MHERLLANQGALEPSDLPSPVQALGLNVPKFPQYLESGTDFFARQIKLPTQQLLTHWVSLGMVG